MSNKQQDKMGIDATASVKSSKTTNANLKVPPLKIVLSSHQNSPSLYNSNEDSSESNEKNDSGNSSHGSHKNNQKNQFEPNVNLTEEPSSKSGAKLPSSPHHKDPNPAFQGSKANIDYLSSSSSTSCSDRSSSTSPSSESESLDSNLTIISDQNQSKVKSEHADQTGQNYSEKATRHNNRATSGDKSASNSGSQKRSSDNNTEPNLDSMTPNSRESALNANQRITRSSQRAALQSKSDNNNDTMAEEPNDVQEKSVELARKAKRRKVESTETDQDNIQHINQQPVALATFSPADYQLPLQNSFELYRDIRKQTYKKLTNLNHVQPKVPHGFKDYLINNGPYLLDGNKLGSGLNGSTNNNFNIRANLSFPRNHRHLLGSKLSHNHPKSTHRYKTFHRHTSYEVPSIQEPPKNLTAGSPLNELFRDQERARHQMRMQHLKERERSILAAEQEILRAYNRVALADHGQDINLSACTYFFYQEQYHYSENEKNKVDLEKTQLVEVDKTNQEKCGDVGTDVISKPPENRSETISQVREEKKESIDEISDDQNDFGVTVEPVNDNDTHCRNNNSKTDLQTNQAQVMRQAGEDESDKLSGSVEDQSKSSHTDSSSTSSGHDLAKSKVDPDKALNKSRFLDQLQEIDDKWDNIKKEMFIRHKNESDSLYAVQCLEWEWKTKEIGLCDVRITYKIEPEHVPRVETSPLDY